jgi:hypothetical protein
MTTKIKNVFEGVLFENLPAEFKKDALYLFKEARPKEVAILAPIVEQFAELYEKVQSAELTKNEDGSFDKESIQVYKDLKSELGTFNASMKKKINEAKRPYMDIDKKFVAVRKTLENNKVSLLDTLEVTYKEYLDEEARKKEERERKKQEKLQAEIDKAKAEAASKMDEAQNIQNYNNLKFNKVKALEDKYEAMHEKYDVSALTQELEAFKALNSLNSFLETEKQDYGFFSLNETQQIDIIETYDKTYKKVVSSLTDVIEKKKEENLKIAEAIKKAPEAIAVNSPIEVKSITTLEQNLVNETINNANSVFLKLDQFILDNKHCNPIIYTLREKFREIKNLEVYGNNN